MIISKNILLSLLILSISSLYPIDFKEWDSEYVDPTWKVAIFGIGAIPVWHWAKGPWQRYAQNYAKQLLTQEEWHHHTIDETLAFFDDYINFLGQEPNFEALLAEMIEDLNSTLYKLSLWSAYLTNQEEIFRMSTLFAKLEEFKYRLSFEIGKEFTESKPIPDSIKVLYESEKPVVIDVYSSYCGPCQKMAPVFDQLAQEYNSDYTFVKANLDDSSDFANEFNISVVPTLIFIKDGIVINRHEGALNREDLLELITHTFHFPAE